MTYEMAYTLIVSTLTAFSAAAFAVLGVISALATGLLVFYWGYRTLMNLPGGYGYNSQKPSGMSRFRKPKATRNASGGLNLLG